MEGATGKLVRLAPFLLDFSFSFLLNGMVGNFLTYI